MISSIEGLRTPNPCWQMTMTHLERHLRDISRCCQGKLIRQKMEIHASASKISTAEESEGQDAVAKRPGLIPPPLLSAPSPVIQTVAIPRLQPN